MAVVSLVPSKRAHGHTTRGSHVDVSAEVSLVPSKKKRGCKPVDAQPQMQPPAQPAKEAKQRKRKAVKEVVQDEELRAQISEKVVNKRAKKAAAPDVQPCEPARKTRKRKAGP